MEWHPITNKRGMRLQTFFRLMVFWSSSLRARTPAAALLRKWIARKTEHTWEKVLGKQAPFGIKEVTRLQLRLIL
jgi:hypothetical protein